MQPAGALEAAERFATGQERQGRKPNLFRFVYGPTKSRALIQNRAFPQPVKGVSPDRVEFSRGLSSHPDSKAREYLKHFSAFSREDLRESQGALRIPPLRSPGFPVENSGVDQLHATLTTASPHTLL
jgi:hypothetical protein